MPNTYPLLVQAVIDEFEDDSTEFRSYIDTAIVLAQDRINHALDSIKHEKETSVVLTSLSNTITKPSDHNYTHQLVLSNGVVLERKTRTYCQDYWPDLTVKATPKYYYETADTAVLVPPTSVNTTVQWVYDGELTVLTSANPTNYYSQRCPSLLFYGVCSQMASFTKNPQALGVYDTKFQENIAVLGVKSKQEKKDAEILANKPTSNSKDNVQQGM